ncbi:hypothetical protein [Nitrospira moscoviensis]|uniref:TPM domain-containing protein n=1 Tax=Nitrospira moscoviensis TaxID=42253 RepID=A0A0K2GHH3_NITMO|nr:hypothetical protein [Nitrospira moscoviensis]ALA60072.1 conserved exported protein of unknown function [Nitrospira moscoviensis]
MLQLAKGLSLLCASLVFWACASAVPPSRIADYVPADQPSDPSLLTSEPRLRAGLVLISDTSAPDAAPNLPDEAMMKLGEELKQEISQVLPVTITDVIPADGIRPLDGNRAQLADLAKKHGLDYLAVVVLSSTEQEYPMSVFVGWTTHMVPGFRRDNWSLLEFALLDVKDGKVLMRADGRGWATLDRPTVPDINQWYPVVWLRPQEPARRYWPPTYEGAPNTLRVVSFNQAARRLTTSLQHAWTDQLEEGSAARRNS